MKSGLNKLFIFFIVLFAAVCAGAQTTNSTYENILPGPRYTIVLMGRALVNGSESYRPNPATTLTISRADNGGSFKVIGKAAFPQNATQLQKNLGKNTADVLKQLKVSDVNAAYRYLLEKGTDSLALLLLNPEIMQALGLAFFDKNRNPQIASVYKIEGGRNAITERVSAGLPSYNFKFVANRFVTSDTALVVSWKGIAAEGRPLPLFANIYRSTGTGNPFTLVNRRIITKNNERDSSTILFGETVQPGNLYTYYMAVSDLAENIGEASDTVHLLSLNNGKIDFIRNFKVTDTADGLYLSWDRLPAKAVYTAIEILKSRQSGSDYVVLDTIAANGTSYLDTKIIPATAYYYKIRPLTYNLPGNERMLFSDANGYKKIMQNAPRPDRPQGITVTPLKGAVEIKWQRGKELDLFGYYVLRGTSAKDMRVISSSVEALQYTDSTLPAGYTGQLQYAVQAINLNQAVSDTSEIVSIAIRQPVVLSPAGGISGQRVPEGISLQWDDVLAKDDRVNGYVLYRRSPGGTYKAINKALLKLPYYIDTTAIKNDGYEYAVASADIFGNKSILSASVKLDADFAETVAPPLNIGIRNLKAGLEIQWPADYQPQAEKSFNIYRREAGNTNFKKLATISGSRNSYMDSNVIPGKLYEYAVSASYRKTEGLKSVAVSERR